MAPRDEQVDEHAVDEDEFKKRNKLASSGYERSGQGERCDEIKKVEAEGRECVQIFCFGNSIICFALSSSIPFIVVIIVLF